MTLNPYIETAHDLQDLVRTHAASNEAQRRLAPQIAEAFADSGLYRIAAPVDCFGSEQDPFTQIAAIEAIAYADGSAGWNLMIGIESFGLVAPGFGDSLELIADPQVVLCSSTAAVGRADRVDGGYRVSGRWQFVSGCHNAQLFGGTVRVWEHDQRIESLPNQYAVMLPGEWDILDTWHTGGMCGSGSHDVQVDDVFVPESRLVAPIGGTDHSSALLRFPLGARLAYNKVGVAWGLARAALDAFIELAEGKQPRFSARGLRERPRAQRALAEAEVRVRAGKALVLEQLRSLWSQVQAREHITSRERALFQLACSDSVRGCIEAVGWVVEAAGTSANQLDHPLERIARDIRVVGQHITVAPHHIEDAGRMLLGLPAQEMMLGGVATLKS